MEKKIVIVNAGPRKGWNTDTLLAEAAKGAEAAGASVERFDLFRLERYTGCISCFGCKKEANKGRCICRDGLTPVLDAIRESDGLIIGSPNYLSQMTASFRALYERLIFQSLTYNAETRAAGRARCRFCSS
jgi:multimeric flavodoxin WrbA